MNEPLKDENFSILYVILFQECFKIVFGFRMYDTARRHNKLNTKQNNNVTF